MMRLVATAVAVAALMFSGVLHGLWTERRAGLGPTQAMTRAAPAGRADRSRGIPMADLRIALPTALKDFIDAEVASGRYSSPSEYLQSLVREAQQRKR